MAALWRDDRVDPNGTLQQRDYFHMYSDDGEVWYQYGSPEPVDLPLKFREQKRSIWNTHPDPIPNGAGSIAVDGKGSAHMLMDERGGTLWYHWHDGNQWQSRRDMLNTADEDIFMIDGKACAVSHKGDEIFFHELRDGNPTTVLLARGYVNGDFNVSVDRTALLHGWLSVMMTTNKSASPRTTSEKYATPVHFANIPVNELAGFKSTWIT